MGGFLVFRYTVGSPAWMHLTLCVSPATTKAEPAIGATAPNDMVPGSDTEPEEEEEEEEAGRNLVAPEDVAAWSDGEDSAASFRRVGRRCRRRSLFVFWAVAAEHQGRMVSPCGPTGDDDQWCLACRPRAVLQEHYILHETDPRFDGWTAWRHSGCRDS